MRGGFELHIWNGLDAGHELFEEILRHPTMVLREYKLEVPVEHLRRRVIFVKMIVDYLFGHDDSSLHHYT